MSRVLLFLLSLYTSSRQLDTVSSGNRNAQNGGNSLVSDEIMERGGRMELPRHHEKTVGHNIRQFRGRFVPAELVLCLRVPRATETG